MNSHSTFKLVVVIFVTPNSICNSQTCSFYFCKAKDKSIASQLSSICKVQTVFVMRKLVVFTFVKPKINLLHRNCLVFVSPNSICNTQTCSFYFHKSKQDFQRNVVHHSCLVFVSPNSICNTQTLVFTFINPNRISKEM